MVITTNPITLGPDDYGAQGTALALGLAGARKLHAWPHAIIPGFVIVLSRRATVPAPARPQCISVDTSADEFATWCTLEVREASDSAEAAHGVIITNHENNPVAVWYVEPKDAPCLVLSEMPPGAREAVIRGIQRIGWEGMEPAKRRLAAARQVELSLGGDPEFETYDYSGTLVYASDISNSLYRQIGCDAEGIQLELRPPPGPPTVFIQNLRRLLLKFSRNWPAYWLDAAGNRAPCGGHIHIGFKVLGRPPEYHVLPYVQALDAALGDSVLVSGAARGSYATREAFEVKDHGFEYRTPPAAIVGDPETALAAYTIAERIIWELAITGQVEISNPPAADELLALGVPLNLINAWQRFLAQGPQPSVPVLENWKVPPPPANCPLIQFGDEWDERVRKTLVRHLRKMLKRRTSLPLLLYGLDERRGDVSTIPVPLPHWRVLAENPATGKSWAAGKIAIGLPWTFRQQASDETIKTVAQAIVNYLNSIEGGAKCAS